jgi:hypothetical protein
MGPVREIYARGFGLAMALPAVLILPFVAELLQHAVEIRLGMYAQGGELASEEMRIRLIFGAVKVLALVLTLLFALRYWRFDGDSGRAARPTIAFFKGLGLFLLIQIGGELAVGELGQLLAFAAGEEASRGLRLALLLSPLLLWLFFANLLLPWFVGLLTEDRAMTLRRSVRGIRGRLWQTFGIFLAGFLPLMFVHYALGYAAMRRPAAFVWPIMVVDAGVVALLVLALSSTYYTLYRRAAERSPA